MSEEHWFDRFQRDPEFKKKVLLSLNKEFAPILEEIRTERKKEK